VDVIGVSTKAKGKEGRTVIEVKEEGLDVDE
jgi:hypothetical protein